MTAMIPTRLPLGPLAVLGTGAAVCAAVVVYWLGTPDLVDRALVIAAAGWLLCRAAPGLRRSAGTPPAGDLGVIEACSGLKSVTALVALAAFVAHVRGLGLRRGAALLALAVPAIVGCNGLRVVATGLLQEHVGRRATEGLAHDALGYA